MRADGVESSSKAAPGGVHSGHRQRLKDKFIHNGIDVLSDHEVLELLLFFCIPMKDTNELAHKMINEFGSLHNLLDAGSQEIAKRCRVSQNTGVLLSLIPSVFKRYSASKWGAKPSMDTSRRAGKYAVSLFIGETKEAFYMLCLDTQSRLIHPVLVSRGTLDETHLYPRQIVETALKYNAASVILTHNHPAASLSPSKNDIVATTKIINALDPINVAVVDHIIVAADKYFSFSEKKLLSLAY
jgi:DNA repair protein RadC